MFAEAPRTSKKEKSALARLEREAQYVEEGPRLADYGIVPESGLELGNLLGLEDWALLYCSSLASMASSRSLVGAHGSALQRWLSVNFSWLSAWSWIERAGPDV